MIVMMCVRDDLLRHYMCVCVCVRAPHYHTWRARVTLDRPAISIIWPKPLIPSKQTVRPGEVTGQGSSVPPIGISNMAREWSGHLLQG